MDKLFGYIIGVLIAGALFTWYNYLIIQFTIPYWKWAILAMPVLLVGKFPPVKYILGTLCCIAIIGQTLVWLGLATAPFIK